MELELQTPKEEFQYRFLRLATPHDIAELLEISYDHLVYQLYKVPDDEKYTEFEIAKKTGGSRKISAPVTSLKIIQQKLNKILQNIYDVKASIHSFVPEKSIVTNAQVHVGQKYVFNIDLKDFFPSINFGRVRGIFLNPPYDLPEDVGTVLAQICCFNNQLPQGAPTSPIISNMICVKMDKHLEGLAKYHKCQYTRYADDITFSTSTDKFPSALAQVNSQGVVEVGQELLDIVKKNGFEVNEKKVRLQPRQIRQSVTGVTVNVKPNVNRRYIRQIRAMLHAWEKYDLEAAEQEFWCHYDGKHRFPDKEPPSFKQVVRGKIEFLGMVRGKEDEVYIRLFNKLAVLAPEYAFAQVEQPDEPVLDKIYIFTEGKTDGKHLKAALNKFQILGYFQNLEIHFLGDGQGSRKLLQMCKDLSSTEHNHPHIFIFDRDEVDIIKDVSGEEQIFKDWRNNIFSFAIPVPRHRIDTPEICIELYYKDDEIRCTDENNRRLFLSNEFSPKSGKLLSDTSINCLPGQLPKSKILGIIDDKVYDANDKNVALPKDEFAQYILDKIGRYGEFDFSEFKLIFEVVQSILRV